MERILAMKLFRCRDMSPMYCPFEILGDTTAKVIEQVVAHCKAEHGLADETVNPAMLALWTARIRDVPDAS
jgi:predicted small metal-binding protein